jgi:hypothetical protein
VKQLPGFLLYAFPGSESKQAEFRGAPVDPAAYYVGHECGSEIASGPHRSEDSALWSARMMTDTSGT